MREEREVWSIIFGYELVKLAGGLNRGVGVGEGMASSVELN